MKKLIAAIREAIAAEWEVARPSRYERRKSMSLRGRKKGSRFWGQVEYKGRDLKEEKILRELRKEARR